MGKISRVILIFNVICILSSSNLFAQGSFKCNFVAKRLSRTFDLQKICEKHSQEALYHFNLAQDDFSDLEQHLSAELLACIRQKQTYSFLMLPQHSPVSLLNLCAYRIARRYTDFKKMSDLINALRSIRFYVAANDCYDPKLAKLIIKLYLEKDYKPTQKCLNTCLCTAAFIGDPCAVNLLLEKGAACNFVNSYDNNYTPLAYTLTQEHRLSTIKIKNFSMKVLHNSYEAIGITLIKKGASYEHPIINPVTGSQNPVFMLTGNTKIFELFKNNLTAQVEQSKELGYNFVVHAFKYGNALLIKSLYEHKAYKDSLSISSTNQEPESMMGLAIKYYTGFDYQELYDFLIAHGATSTTEREITLEEFGFRCLFNAITTFNYEAAVSLIQSQVALDGLTEIPILGYLIQGITTHTNKKNIIKMIELLTHMGILFDSKINDELTALDYAINLKVDPEIIEALVITPIIFAIKTMPTNKLKLANLIQGIHELKNNKNIGYVNMKNYKDSKGKTALDYAIELHVDDSVIEMLKA